jgi:hypothetical protein
MKKPAFTRVKQETSAPYAIPARDGFASHNTHERDVCPTSTHRRKTHMARATTRQTVTTTYGDHCQCQFCGHQWQQEWMPGLI